MAIRKSRARSARLSVRLKRYSETLSYSDAVRKFTGDEPFDPESEDDRRAVDLIYEREQVRLAGRDFADSGEREEARQALIDRIVTRTGITPTQVRAEMEAALAEAEAEEAADAVEAVAGEGESTVEALPGEDDIVAPIQVQVGIDVYDYSADDPINDLDSNGHSSMPLAAVVMRSNDRRIVDDRSGSGEAQVNRNYSIDDILRPFEREAGIDGNIVLASEKVFTLTRRPGELPPPNTKRGFGIGRAVLPTIDYHLNDNRDRDWRGLGFKERELLRHALDIAFQETGYDRSTFKVEETARDANGKSFPVEWKNDDGAIVSIDAPHSWDIRASGPDAPHVGWKRSGKRKRGGGEGETGHILLDSVPYFRSSEKYELFPERLDRKGGCGDRAPSDGA